MICWSQALYSKQQHHQHDTHQQSKRCIQATRAHLARVNLMGFLMLCKFCSFDLFLIDCVFEFKNPLLQSVVDVALANLTGLGVQHHINTKSISSHCQSHCRVCASPCSTLFSLSLYVDEAFKALLTAKQATPQPTSFCNQLRKRWESVAPAPRWGPRTSPCLSSMATVIAPTCCAVSSLSSSG